MKVWLLRHCEAESGAREDPTRALTETGHGQAATMATFLRREIGRADVVLSSYFKRAQDTAKPIAAALHAPIVDLWQMHPDAAPAEAMEAIRRHGHGDVVIVTHGPLVYGLLAEMCGFKTDDASFGHGHCAHIHGGKLHWLVTPHLVQRDDTVTEAAIAVADALLDSLSVRESAQERRDAALPKAHASAQKALRRYWDAQQDALLKSPFVTNRFKESDEDAIAGAVRATLGTLPANDLIGDLFDNAIAAALDAAATHVASDFAYSDQPAYASFEGRYLANKGFARIAPDIDRATVKQTAQAVAKAYEDGAGYQGVVDAIKATFADMSDSRAGIIAQTELNAAYNAGILDLGHDAGATQKDWETESGNPCPACLANAAQGRIPINEAFQSGHLAAPVHPSCQCQIVIHA